MNTTKTLRAMTILSLEDGIFDFFMVAIEDGVTSARMSLLQTNDRCYVEHPLHGNFHTENLPNLINKDLWMMGTGTGIAPYLSMLKNSDAILQRCANILLVHSVKQEQHLCSVEHISTLQTQYPTLTYVPIVTREKQSFSTARTHSNIACKSRTL